MGKLKFSEKEYELAKHIVLSLLAQLKKNHPKLTKVDSNLIHFMAYEVIKKEKLTISNGWFKNGPYVPVIDDILINLGIMDESQHQIRGDETPMTKWIECECHNNKGDLKK